MRITNRRNRIVYSLWAPFYDLAIQRFIRSGRVRAMEVLAPRATERILLVGVGTGADIPLLPEGIRAVGIDLSPEMLARAKARLPLPGREIRLQEGDAQALPFESASFDAVVLNLILCIVPDPSVCLLEVLRVLRPGGRAVVFDKFLPDGTSPSLGRQLGNLVTTMFGTSINRRLGDMIARQPWTIIRDESSLLGGMFRVVLLRRDEQPAVGVGERG